MGPAENCLEISGSFSWGFTSNQPKKDGKKGADKKVAEESEANAADQTKKLAKFITLKDVKMAVRKGEFISIIGDVGSGKSSLLQALIGDLIYLPQEAIDEFGGINHEATSEEFDVLKQKLLGPDFKVREKPIKIKGSVSFVEQGSWIQNKTIKDNILFGLPLNAKRYAETIKNCQLARDLEILPAGDQTEIGEKGINLSGGQKARVSLARAVYANSDIIMMDDPISALDANVRKKIFKHVFQGMLKDKTRILVTHAIDFLHFTDRIAVLKDGKIQAFGTFEELADDPHLQEVLAINKKNLEESKQMQRDAIEGQQSNTNEISQLLIGDQTKNDDDKRSSLLLASTISAPNNFEQPGQRLNNSTFVRSSEVSSSIRITQSQSD